MATRRYNIVEMALLLHDYSSSGEHEFDYTFNDGTFQIYTFVDGVKYSVSFDEKHETVNTVRAKIDNLESKIEDTNGEEDTNRFLDSDSLRA